MKFTIDETARAALTDPGAIKALSNALKGVGPRPLRRSRREAVRAAGELEQARARIAELEAQHSGPAHDAVHALEQALSGLHRALHEGLGHPSKEMKT